MTVKVVGLLKRRTGMSVEDFRAYYESTHRLVGEKYLRGYATRYVRRYLDPQGEVDEDAPDVILEVWYPDQATFEAASGRLQRPEAALEILEDERQLFDRERNRFFVVDECESDLS